MLTCIACSKQLNPRSLNNPHQQQQDEDDAIATPINKRPTIKTLTTQIKDMALRYKNCKPCTGKKEGRRYEESVMVGYRRTASSSSVQRGVWSGEGTPGSVSGRTESVVLMEEDEPKEWMAQVEPGVFITFFSIPQGGNDLKRIRFSRELFNKWQAQRWWTENYDKVMELYNVQRFNQQAIPLPTPPRSENESSKIGSTEGSPATPPLSKERLPRNFPPRLTGLAYSSCDPLDHHAPLQHYESYGLASTPKLSNISATKTEISSVDASARSSLSREVDHSGELSVSNASDMETEWVEQDEPGVYITIRALHNGTRELRRVRFSRERFGEMNARLWWEENKGRIQEQYL